MPKTNLPVDSTLRKEMPICTGVLDYFPDALAAVARISVLGNEKHNPGEPLHWARGKSMDQPDCIMRHCAERDTIDLDDGALHDVKLAWRALANAQLAIESRIARGLPIFDEEIIARNRALQKAAREGKKPALASAIEQLAAAANPGAQQEHFEKRETVTMPNEAILGLGDTIVIPEHSIKLD